MTAKIKFFKNDSRAIAPRKANNGDIGYDLFAMDDIELTCGKAVKVDSGLKFVIPDGYALKLHSRSGHGFKADIRLANSTGLIDGGYLGVVVAKLRKDSAGDFLIKAGEAFAQLEVVRIEPSEMVEISEDEFNATSSERGASGFGSTTLRQERFFIDDGADPYIVKFDGGGNVKEVLVEFNPDRPSWYRYKPERIQPAFKQWFDGGCQQGATVETNVALENMPHFHIKLTHIK